MFKQRKKSAVKRHESSCRGCKSKTCFWVRKAEWRS